MRLQWNPSKVDTIGSEGFVLYSEVSVAQGLVAGHAPVLIVSNYDGNETMDDETDNIDERFTDLQLLDKKQRNNRIFWSCT